MDKGRKYGNVGECRYIYLINEEEEEKVVESMFILASDAYAHKCVRRLGKAQVLTPPGV